MIGVLVLVSPLVVNSTILFISKKKYSKYNVTVTIYIFNLHFKATDTSTSCKQECRFAVPFWGNVRFGLRILDRMRYIDRAMSLQELIQLVITSRVQCNAKLEPLPITSRIIPLAAESLWRYLLSLTDRRSQRGQPTLRRLSLKSRECVVHLLEYLELLYIVHKVPYDSINNTFLYYGTIINKRLNQRRKKKIAMDNSFWSLQFVMADILQAEERPTGKRTSPMSVSILEWTIIYIQEHVSAGSRVHVASIRSVFMESRPDILSYMWPSVVHFESFPNDKDIYIIPVIPTISSPGAVRFLTHVTLAVATVGERRETGNLQLYDASRNVLNQSNLQPILDRLNQCHVGGVKRWKVAESVDDLFYPGPVQSSNMCVVACCCFGLWKSAIAGFQDWGENKSLTQTATTHWWKYRNIVCQMILQYVQTLDEGGFINWMVDTDTGIQYTDPSLLYRFPSIRSGKPFN
jgi:hypothetical protein